MSRLRLVVADDNAPYLHGITRAVATRAELELVAACVDGTEALEAVLRLAPDVALLDVQMPGLTGPEVVARARALRGPHATTFVLLSAWDEVARLAGECGAARGLHKELTRRAILDAVVGARGVEGLGAATG